MVFSLTGLDSCGASLDSLAYRPCLRVPIIGASGISEDVVRQIWRGDLFQKYERNINGRVIATLRGERCLYVGRFLFVSEAEWEKHKTELLRYRDSVIICNIMFDDNSNYCQFEWGFHTFLAIELLQAYADEIYGKVLLDAGSGSDAILGTVAYRLGAKKVFCVEGSAIRAKKSEQYLLLNGVNKKYVELINADFSLMGDIQGVDIVVSNLPNNGFHERDMRPQGASQYDGQDNWHRFLADKFSPEFYFLCGMIGKGKSYPQDTSINTLRGVMDMAGYGVIFEKDFYYIGGLDVSTAFVLRPEFSQQDSLQGLARGGIEGESDKHDDIEGWLKSHPELHGLPVLTFDFHPDFHMWVGLKRDKLIGDIFYVYLDALTKKFRFYSINDKKIDEITALGFSVWPVLPKKTILSFDLDFFGVLMAPDAARRLPDLTFEEIEAAADKIADELRRQGIDVAGTYFAYEKTYTSREDLESRKIVGIIKKRLWLSGKDPSIAILNRKSL